MKPQTLDEWEQLLYQAAAFANRAHTSYTEAKEANMPEFFIAILTRMRFKRIRRYYRVKRRVQQEKRQACLRLLNALGLQ